MTGNKYIATTLHKAIELAPDDDLLQEAATLPHYVIDPRLVEMLGREDVHRSISAMIEAGMARLPFQKMLVEFDAENGVRRFTILRENEGQDGFTADLMAFSRGVLTVSQRRVSVDLTGTGIGVRFHATEIDGLAAGFAVAIALMMLNTQGIEREAIVPRALNKSREARGLPSVPRHTIVRIGTIVDALGREHAYSGVRHMPLHLRAGHARRQHFGRGRSEIKWVYIPPTLVNFKPGDELRTVRMPKRVLTK
jgi:hypothetical protein